MAGTMADHIFKAMCNRIHDDLEDMQRHIEIIRQLLPKFFPQNLIDQTTCDESFSEEVVVQACDELSHRGKDEHTHERQGMDSRSNPFQEGEDDTSQMAIYALEDIIGCQCIKTRDLVTSRLQVLKNDPTVVVH
ncbi:uncharacterized protein LOC107851767 isoform X3 [Capsicum annuum]|uniref:uncharacterized protein LOC107851767 isoform X3 n=1 Tax=Capsicum annuum TaxID=4072 RepID=UPI001FB07503|nr:uncharacterized protein LOC107851767 isoform X3 [Capsicum annuum]